MGRLGHVHLFSGNWRRNLEGFIFALIYLLWLNFKSFICFFIFLFLVGICLLNYGIRPRWHGSIKLYYDC